MTFHPMRGGHVLKNLSADTKQRHAQQHRKDGAQASLVTGLLVAAAPLTGGFSLVFAALSGACAVGHLSESLTPIGGFKDDNYPNRLPISPR